MNNSSASLTQAYPSIAEEWNYPKNQPLTPDDVSPHSNKKVWWNCSKGHEYEVSVDKRTSRNYACPYCSGKRVLPGFNDFLTIAPVELSSEWDYEKNTDLAPTAITFHSNKTAWWKCSKCGHSWTAKVNARANGRGCPVCSVQKRIKSFRSNYLKKGVNDLATLRPDLIAEWDLDKNAPQMPEEFTSHSKEKVWWHCLLCGNEWQATIKNRVDNNSGCPRCTKHTRTSFPEQALYFYVHQAFPDAVSGYTAPFLIKASELDIFIPSLQTGIEYDGVAWHKDKKSLQRDLKKYLLCRENGITLIRIREASDIMENLCDHLIIRDDLTDKGLEHVILEMLRFLSTNNITVDIQTDRADIVRQYVTALQSRSISARYPEVVLEWDIEKNGGLTPDKVSASSEVKYWWKCNLGHSYQMSPKNKLLMHFGCPICSGHQLLSGFNDLETRYPRLADEWDYEKNNGLTPSKTMPGSMTKVWWKCSKGHSYQASPNSRISSNTGCPYCANKRALLGFNDLLTTHPLEAQWWDTEKNEDISPTMVTAGSGKKVWWKCPKGHSWKKAVTNQIHYPYCPVCAGRILVQGVNDLSVTHPSLANEWDYEKNKELKPQNITFTCPKKVWWICSECGKEWQAQINVRVSKGSGCPSCGYRKKMQMTRVRNIKASKKDLGSIFPEIAAEWDYERNINLDPTTLSPGSNIKVWWVCSKGHSYQAWMSDRTGKHKTGCPYCAGKRKLQ